MHPRLVLGLVLAFASLTAASPTRSPRPLVGPYRVDENWTFLRSPALREQPLDRLKYLPLGPVGRDVSLTLGGEARHRYEFFNNDAWGRVPDDRNGYHLTRFMLFGDLRAGERARVLVELKSNNIGGKSTAPKPPDEDILDLHQGFVEFAVPSGRDLKFMVRTGRQEFNYGSARLITFRDGPNTRQSFDAVLARLSRDAWKVDAFYGRPAETDPGVLDDQTNEGEVIYGIYGVTPLAGRAGAHLDLYLLGYDRDRARFVSGTGEEERYSAGTRFWGRRGSIDFNFEGVFQWGDFRDDSISAWTLASDTGYTWDSAFTKPRTYLKANVISGDRRSSDGRLNSFNALYPRGGYFGDIGLVGPSNLVNLHPGVQGRFSRRWGYHLMGVLYWRAETEDGIYAANGVLQRGPGGSGAREIGTQADVIVNWSYNPYFFVEFTFSRFWAGRYLEETGPAADVDYVSVLTRIRF